MPIREFVADAHAPAAARRFAEDALGELVSPLPSDLSDDVALVVSELVTNAVRAGSGSAVVELALVDDRLAVRVTDAAGGWPQQRDAAITDTTGRGLALVSAISTSWGVRLTDTGKLVWAELALP